MNKIASFIKFALCIVAGLFVLTGCIEEYEAELPEGDTRVMVVNGTIYSNRYSLFHLTWSASLNHEQALDGYMSIISSSYDPYYSVEPVWGARVTICGTDGSEYECPELAFSYENYFGTGIYGCNTPELNPDVSYYLTIKYDDDVYQSTPEKPIRTPDIEALEYFQKDSLSNVEVLLSTAAPDNPDQTAYYTWNYGETWELRPARTTNIYFDIDAMQKKELPEDQRYPTRGWKYGHDETILSASTAHYAGGQFNKYQLLSIPCDDERIFWYYSNEVTQRAISKAEYEYDMACVQAGWEMGGLFSPQPSALPTNIHCRTSSKRAIGYVGCSQNVVSKRKYIDGTKISRILPKPGPFEKLDDCSEEDCYKMIKLGWILYLWYDGRIVWEPLVTYWARPEDFDVRLQGASTWRPDYMPPFDEENE